MGQDLAEWPVLKRRYFIAVLEGRDGREAEGAPLLRVYRGNSIEGSNPSLSAIILSCPRHSWCGLERTLDSS